MTVINGFYSNSKSEHVYIAFEYQNNIVTKYFNISLYWYCLPVLLNKY